MSARDLFNKLKESKAAHAISALSDFVAGGGKRVPPEVYDARMETCTKCSFILPGTFPRCDSCGCLLQVKLTFPAERCPEGYWTEHHSSDGTGKSSCSTC